MYARAPGVLRVNTGVAKSWGDGCGREKRLPATEKSLVLQMVVLQMLLRRSSLAVRATFQLAPPPPLLP
jgi:hypothetical protein